MFRLTALDHVVLRVSDVQRCLDFYQRVLGCTVENVNAEIGLYQLRAGDCIIDLVDVAAPLGVQGGCAPQQQGHNLDHFCVRVEPFEEAEIRRHLAGFGIEAGPVADNWGADGRGPSIYISDPEGNGIELKGPPRFPFDPEVGYVPA